MNLVRQSKSAEPVLRESLRFASEHLAVDHPERAACMTFLAACFRSQGKLADAEQLLGQALELRQRVLGKHHPSTGETHLELARALAHRDLAAAELEIRIALDSFNRTFGAEHPRLAAAYHTLAWNLHHQGKTVDAEKAAEQASRAFESARLRVSYDGLERVDFWVRSPLLTLAALRAHNQKPREAWQALESNLARGLLDAISDRLLRPRDADERRRELEILDQLQRIAERISVLSKDQESEIRC